jgi:anti-sigma regulatory factor (Ser/Thr protein kinase)
VDRPHTFRQLSDLNQVPGLREQFRECCLAEGVDEEDLQGTALVLTELVNNAIEHGCRGPADAVEGWYLITPTEIRIEVTDPGEVLTTDDFSSSDADGFAETGRGAGLFLVQALSDEVQVERASVGGTTVRVRKSRRKAVAS